MKNKKLENVLDKEVENNGLKFLLDIQPTLYGIVSGVCFGGAMYNFFSDNGDLGYAIGATCGTIMYGLLSASYSLKNKF